MAKGDAEKVLRESHGCLSLERVIHDQRQLVSLDELVVGKRYLFKNINLEPDTVDDFVIVALEISREGPEKWWFAADSRYKGKVVYHHVADMGIVPYPEDEIYIVLRGKWNATNYMVPAE